MATLDRLNRAREAQPEWAARSVRERLRILSSIRRRIMADVDRLVSPLSKARGVSPAEALVTEVIPLLDGLRYLERIGPRVLKPRTISNSGRPMWLWGSKAVVHRMPHGLVLVIGPGNYPLFLTAAQASQALAAGNAVAIKPGCGGQEVVQEFLAIAHAAGVPEELAVGLEDSVGAGAQALDASIDFVCFTGSFAAGSEIQKKLAAELTPSVMELSGCDAMIVDETADVELSVRSLVYGLTLNRGRTCIAPRRVLVSAGLMSRFLKALQAQWERSSGFDLEPEPGIRRATLQWIEDGARVLAGSLGEAGESWKGPLVVGPVEDTVSVSGLDWFSGLSVLVPYENPADAVRIANDHRFQLGATVFTRDRSRWRYFERALRCGVVVSNDMVAPTADPRLPFGGRGASGFGVTRGALGLEALTVPKISMRGAKGVRQRTRPIRENDYRLFATFAQLAHGGGWRAAWNTIRDRSH